MIVLHYLMIKTNRTINIFGIYIFKLVNGKAILNQQEIFGDLVDNKRFINRHTSLVELIYHQIHSSSDAWVTLGNNLK